MIGTAGLVHQRCKTVWPQWVAGFLFALGCLGIAAPASAETRTLKLYYIHTKEKAEITYKRNGRYDQSGLAKINRFLRDWRRNEPTKMDPRLLDVVWETYKSVGARDYIHVVSAYRSPATNSMLRKRSNGVAEKSQHMLGKAMDFYIPGVPLKKLRDAGLKAQVGGVGYYPRSGSPFVHLDVGNVRHWPRMSRKELVAVFPNGKTLHVPSDGKPLPGFDTALASYNSRKKSGQTALALASTSSRSSGGGLLSALFGGGADEEEESSSEFETVVRPKGRSDDAAEVNIASRAPAGERVAPRKPAEPVAVARAEARPDPGIRVVSPEEADRASIPPIEEPVAERQTPESIIAALPSRAVPLPAFAPRPKAEVPAVEVASAAAVETTGVAASEALRAAAPLPPADIPFGPASAPLPAEEAVVATAEPAPGIPLPTWRPTIAQPVDPVAAASDPVLVAEADASKLGGPPLPQMRPDTVQADLVAALPSMRPEEPAAGLLVMLPGQRPAEAGLADKAGQLAMLQTGATPKLAVLSREAGTDPAAAVGGSVKTTRKASRPTARDSKPERRAIALAAQPAAARWAFDEAYVARVQTGTRAPSFAYNHVRTAPREVYTAGFSRDDRMANANRFSGSAVGFLPVARFETN